MGSLVQYLPRVIFFVVAVPAIVFHEVAHGWVSLLLGDPTAQRAGRLSLNPLRHVDPFGTVLLPALLAISGAPVFGYAKPVPINPWFYKDRRLGMLLTGLAGPTTNLLMAVVGALVARGLLLVGPALGAAALTWVELVLVSFVYVNLVLMFFNLIPIPPFDGSRVIPIFLNDSAMRVYAQIEQFGFVIIFALIFLGQGLLSAYFNATVFPIARFLLGGELTGLLF